MSFQPLMYIEVTLQIYKEAAINAARGLTRNWVILVGSLAAYLLFLFLASLLTPLGIVGSFILGMIGIALLSLYYAWIAATVNKDKLSFRDLLNFDYELFSCTIGVGFILYIGSVVFQTSFQHPSAPQWIPAIYGLAIFLIFNSLPEIIHQRRHDSLQAFRSAFEFNKESWVEWFAPFLLLLLPWYFVSSYALLLSLSGSDVLLPIITIQRAFVVLLSALPDIVQIILAFILGHWFMIFRGFLFNELSTGSRRKRIYKKRM